MEESRKKKLLAACIVGVAIIFVVIAMCALFLPRQPIYQGKAISQWVAELPVGQRLNAFGFMDTETPAKKVLRSIGTNAIPYLARGMMNQRDDAFLTDFKTKLWFHLPFLQRYFPRPVYSLEVRRATASLLTEMVTKNPEVVATEQVIRDFSKLTCDKDSDLRIIAISTLGILAVKRQSQSALSRAIVALDSPYEGVRSWAAWKLSDGGPAQSQALPALNRRLSDPSDAVRINAALAVYRIGNQTNEAVRVLIGALRSKEPTNRGNAALHLSLIGPAAKNAVPALEALSSETNEYVRQWARTALSKIDPHDHAQN